MVAAQGGEREREVVDVSRALDVDAHRQLARDAEVVDGGEVKEHGRLGARQFEVGRRKTEPRKRDVAFEESEVFGARAGLLRDASHFRACAFHERGLHEQDEARALLGHALDEPPGDEAGEAGHENRLVTKRHRMSEPPAVAGGS